MKPCPLITATQEVPFLAALRVEEKLTERFLTAPTAEKGFKPVAQSLSSDLLVKSER